MHLRHGLPSSELFNITQCISVCSVLPPMDLVGFDHCVLLATVGELKVRAPFDILNLIACIAVYQYQACEILRPALHAAYDLVVEPDATRHHRP